MTPLLGGRWRLGKSASSEFVEAVDFMLAEPIDPVIKRDVSGPGSILSSYASAIHSCRASAFARLSLVYRTIPTATMDKTATVPRIAAAMAVVPREEQHYNMAYHSKLCMDLTYVGDSGTSSTDPSSTYCRISYSSHKCNATSMGFCEWYEILPVKWFKKTGIRFRWPFSQFLVRSMCTYGFRSLMGLRSRMHSTAFLCDCSEPPLLMGCVWTGAVSHECPWNGVIPMSRSTYLYQNTFPSGIHSMVH